MTPIITVIIPTHNGTNKVEETIASLVKQDLPRSKYEVIVVDNASTDNTKDAVEEASRKYNLDVRYIYEPKLGLHNARHAGARSAHGEILAYTDDDTICSKAWLRELLSCYGSNEVGCVGGRVLPKWEVPPPKWILRYPSALALLDLGDEVKELRWPQAIYGLNFSIKKNLLFALGGFNPDSIGRVRLGDGEIGLLRKVYKAGWKVMYNPRALIYHRIPASRLTLEYMKIRFANQGAMDVYSRYHNRHLGLINVIFNALKFIVAAMGYHLLAMPSFSRTKLVQYDRILRAFYCWSRARYSLRLLYDQQLQNLVAKERWI